jgi:hypothetical protein
MQMAVGTESPRGLLDAAYEQLALRQGDLLDATDDPSGEDPVDWLNKGEWLSLGKHAGVEKIFFVNDDPVVVFAGCGSEDQEEIRRRLNKIWCMARPRRLFLATPGELSVYDLTRPPVRRGEPLDSEGRRLKLVKRIGEVQLKLAAYRREHLETGLIPGDARFGEADSRADESLIRDLKLVRDQLVSDRQRPGLEPTYAHSLIGRSIFIRYLEDRGVLLPKDFKAVAGSNKIWRELLERPISPEPVLDRGESLYLRVLQDKEFTFAFFERLARDFNGDIFPVDPREKDDVTQDHLNLLRRFLSGEGTSAQRRLFFFAYDFSVIPIELISNIYENFYTATKGETRGHGVHYTRGALVEYVLSKTLTPERLSTNPRVMDPACGSGIFLVESFRRIVRYRQRKNGRRLRLDELKKILRTQIAGIEIEPEAVRVAAFSLSLALLHYVEPPDIWRDKRLPCLKYEEGQRDPKRTYFDILLAKNAFRIDKDVPDPDVRKRFLDNCADVVVGNPPWGAPAKDDPATAHEAAQAAYSWCDAERAERPIGDNELSQAFVHRALHLLRERGTAGLLVSTGVFFNDQTGSERFRRQWLRRSRLRRVVNFAHVRTLFFNGAIAPFAAIVFEKTSDITPEHSVEYWTAKRTPATKRLASVVMSRTDRKAVKQQDLLNDNTLWKVFWWGSHHDRALVSAIELNPALSETELEGRKVVRAIGRGLEGGSRSPSRTLRKYRVLPTEAIHRYGPLDLSRLLPTPWTRGREGEFGIYQGTRILIKRGPRQMDEANGVVVATLAESPFCVRHSVYGAAFEDFAKDHAKIVLGIFWSSLARYYFWMTAGSWGMWHHELHEGDIRRLPIRFPKDKGLRRRIFEQVERLRQWAPVERDLLRSNGLNKAEIQRRTRTLERELDDAIFDLYELTDAERDLVTDMCEVGLEFFYRHANSRAVSPVVIDVQAKAGRIEDLGVSRDRGAVSGYLRTFIEAWNREIQPRGELSWRLVQPTPDMPMLGAIFTTESGLATAGMDASSDEETWARLFNQLDKMSIQQAGLRRIFIDGMVRAATDTDLLIVKRNERRLWTRSAAREDAEATMVQVMNLVESKRGG